MNSIYRNEGPFESPSSVKITADETNRFDTMLPIGFDGAYELRETSSLDIEELLPPIDLESTVGE